MTVILNKYKNILDDLIDSSDIESPDWPKSINNRTHNGLRSKAASLSLLEKDCLDKDVLVMLLERAPKIKDF